MRHHYLYSDCVYGHVAEISVVDATTFAELQEGLLIVFGPILIWCLILIATGTILTVIGVAVLEAATRMTR